MARIFVIAAALLLIVAAAGFLWSGLAPPGAPIVAVSHALPVSQFAGGV